MLHNAVRNRNMQLHPYHSAVFAYERLLQMLRLPSVLLGMRKQLAGCGRFSESHNLMKRQPLQFMLRITEHPAKRFVNH
ncbi:hypothetical protein D3C72_923580 [compost metagenome]